MCKKSKLFNNTVKVFQWYKPNFALNVTQQNSYSISHLLGTVTTQWLDSNGVVTVVNCRQHGDYTVDQQQSIHHGWPWWRKWWKKSFCSIVSKHTHISYGGKITLNGIFPPEYAYWKCNSFIRVYSQPWGWLYVPRQYALTRWYRK